MVNGVYGNVLGSLRKLPKSPFVVLAFFLFLSCLGGKTRLLELTTHFKLQYCMGASIFAVLYASIRAWRWFGAAVLCVVVSASSLLGWYRKPAQVYAGKRERTVKLLLSNVLYSNNNYQAVIDLVQNEQPDLIFFQEFTGTWEEQTKGLRHAYPYGLVESMEGVGGIAALSRLPLNKAEVVETGNYLGPTLQVEALIEGRTFTVLTAHPPPPNPSGFPYRNAQLQRLAERLNPLPAPKAFIGDLNATMWSPYLREFAAASGLQNARQGFGIVPTWPTTWYLQPLQIPIDHCFVSRDLRVNEVHAGVPIGSDHLPLVVELALPLNP